MLHFSTAISTSDSMTASKKEKNECLNSAAEVLVQSYNEVEKEGEKHKDNEVNKELKQKVDRAYESCANQEQVTQEGFTEPDEEKEVMPLRQFNFTVPKHISINHNDKAKMYYLKVKMLREKKYFLVISVVKVVGIHLI